MATFVGRTISVFHEGNQRTGIVQKQFDDGSLQVLLVDDKNKLERITVPVAQPLTIVRCPSVFNLLFG